MSYTSYQRINSLGETHFIGGTNYTMRFNFKDENGDIIDLSEASLVLKVCEYGNPRDVLLIKEGTLVATNSFKVYFGSVETKFFEGVYSFQITVTLADDTVIRAAQGILVITGAIQENWGVY